MTMSYGRTLVLWRRGPGQDAALQVARVRLLLDIPVERGWPGAPPACLRARSCGDGRDVDWRRWQKEDAFGIPVAGEFTISFICVGEGSQDSPDGFGYTPNLD